MSVDTSPPGLGAAFRRRRKDLGLTQAEAAERAAMSVTTWKKLEATGDVTATTWKSAAHALGWPISAKQSLAAGTDPAAIEDLADEDPLSRSDAVEEIEAVLHRTDLDPPAIEMAMAVVRRLMDF